MLIGLDDFDSGMFLVLDDSNIFIYYSDFDTIPELIDLVPIGSFDDVTQSYLWKNLDKDTRIEVALLFMQRDFYAEKNPDTKDIWIDQEIFCREFDNIPEVINFFTPYKTICRDYQMVDENGDLVKIPMPPGWEGWAKPVLEGWVYTDKDEYGKDAKYIDRDNYPCWCQVCREYTYDDQTCQCAYKIPTWTISPKELNYLSLVYFNGIYRTRPESIQNFGEYDILTDINFEQNKYSLIVNIKEFFTKEFQWFLKTIPGSIPFGCDYGTYIKHAVQTKDNVIRRIEIENEINFFIFNFNKIYQNWVNVREIKIENKQTDVGGNTWFIDVHAKILEEDLIFRIEAAES
jgi:hypothetical protein